MRINVNVDKFLKLIYNHGSVQTDLLKVLQGISPDQSVCISHVHNMEIHKPYLSSNKDSVTFHCDTVPALNQDLLEGLMAFHGNPDEDK